MQIERFIADEDYGAVLDVINEIVALQEAHDLALEEEFHFTYAQLAFATGFHETAIDSVNEYLPVAGRDGELYRGALELLDSAEEVLWLAEAGRRRAEAERQRIEEERRREQARQQQENYELDRRQIDLAAAYQSDRRLEHFQWLNSAHLRDLEYEVTRGEFEGFVESSRYRTDAENGGRYSRGTSWKRPRSFLSLPV